MTTAFEADIIEVGGAVTGRSVMAAKSFGPLLVISLIAVLGQSSLAGGRGPSITNNNANDANGRHMEWFRQQGPPPQAYASYSGSYADGYPAPEVQAVPAARARAAAARQDYWSAYNRLNRVIREAKRNFERSEEMQDALAAEKRAYQALLDARTDVLAKLARDPDYRAAIRLREEAHQKIAERRSADENVVPADMVALATEKLTYATAARSREVALTTNNPEIETRLADFQDASARVIRMRAEFDEDLRVQPDVIAAREAHEQARAAHSVAAEYLDSVVRARRIGLIYASDFYNFEPAYFRTGRVFNSY
jgi:hypothetical protein